MRPAAGHAYVAWELWQARPSSPAAPDGETRYRWTTRAPRLVAARWPWATQDGPREDLAE